MYFKNLQWAGTSLVVQWTRIFMPTISSIPGLGRLHMPQATKARAPQILSLCSSAHKPQLMSPCATTTEAHTPRACAQQQKPAHCKPRAAPTHCNQRKPTRSKEDPGKPKINKRQQQKSSSINQLDSQKHDCKFSCQSLLHLKRILVSQPRGEEELLKSFCHLELTNVFFNFSFMHVFLDVSWIH